MKTQHESLARGDWKLADLLIQAGVGSRGITPPESDKVTSLTDDSRAVVPGSCFVAIRGTGFDGHDFVDAACRAGASAIVVDRAVVVPPSVMLVTVPDSRVALARMAACYYGVQSAGRNAVRLIGITGTNGKTTISWLLRSIFRAAGQPTALIGTIEYDLVSHCRAAPLTTPGSLELCRLLAEARSAGAVNGVLETSSHALAQRRCDGLTFAAGIFTNLTGDHLDYHGTMERYAAAKRRLFALRGENGVAVVNVDDSMGTLLAESVGGAVLSYGLNSPTAQVRASIESSGRSGSEIRLIGCGDDVNLRFPLVGEHNVSNAVAAAAAAFSLGVEVSAIREGLESCRGVPGRLQRVDEDGSLFSVFVDYAHTDAALASVLRSLRPLTPGRLICVFGCGGDRDRRKRPRMAAAVASLADVAVVTSDNPRTEDPARIIEEVISGFGSHASCLIESVVDRGEAIARAVARAGKGDTVLIAGKGHETYQLIGGEVRAFDDVAVAKACLDAAGDSSSGLRASWAAEHSRDARVAEGVR